jgi:hypothetical protein
MADSGIVKAAIDAATSGQTLSVRMMILELLLERGMAELQSSLYETF